MLIEIKEKNFTDIIKNIDDSNLNYKTISNTLIALIGSKTEKNMFLNKFNLNDSKIEDFLYSRDFKLNDTIINVGNSSFGSDKVIIAGPCAIESKNQLYKTANYVKKFGVDIIRGGAYKPRTSPYSFQGLKDDGLKIFNDVKKTLNLNIVTESISESKVDLVSKYSDIVQVGSRNGQNYGLLKKVGDQNKPILLKRGMHMSVKEFLLSAEYILLEGNSNVILCERGIRINPRTEEVEPDFEGICELKKKTHLPIIFDPSHSTQDRDKVIEASIKALNSGADGLIVEVHPDPENALCDGNQSLTFDLFKKLMKKIN